MVLVILTGVLSQAASITFRAPILLVSLRLRIDSIWNTIE